jgi:hypothetical protein
MVRVLTGSLSPGGVDGTPNCVRAFDESVCELLHAVPPVVTGVYTYSRVVHTQECQPKKIAKNLRLYGTL